MTRAEYEQQAMDAFADRLFAGTGLGRRRDLDREAQEAVEGRRDESAAACSFASRGWADG